MADLPSGTVTLLFTDIEDSTRLEQQLGESYADVLAECRQILRTTFVQWHGQEVDTQGDAFFVVFARASDAVSAAVEMQRALASHVWLQDTVVRVRIGMHTGEPSLTSEGYVGLDVPHAARIMSAGHGGQVLLSATTQELVKYDLPDSISLRDLGEHRLKDLQYPSHLYQLEIAGLPADFPPLKTLDIHPHNLPIQPTPFIGREREVATVQQLLVREDVRLLTLTGSGGSGKTRLGLQVAAELSDHFPDGVFFVNLAPTSDPDLVMPTIAQALGVKESATRPVLEQLQAFLEEKELLLVLDNFEQVVSAAPRLSDLLAACPHLRLLVTSRQMLRLSAEHEFAVPPLSLPDLKHLPDLVALSQYEAVTLFIARARSVKPDFTLTNANAHSVASICARLDGLPLGIELAAARVKYFPPQALLTHLEQGLAVLAGGARDLPLRHQTLHNTLAWSYDLLAPEEQTLFRRLAVFVNGCTWQAAEQVCTVASTLGEDTLEGLISLVDKSLLRQEELAEGEARFWMLQVLREFGLERLADAGELEATRHAHALYYLALAQEAEPYLRGAEQSRWFALLEREQDNLRLALAWLLERARLGMGGEEGRQQAERALRLCVALFWFWDTRDMSEGWLFLEQALTVGEGVAAVVRVKALFAAANMVWTTRGDSDRAEALARESLKISRELGDRHGIATSLMMLAAVTWTRSQYAVARAQLEEAQALLQEGDDPWNRGVCLTQLARIAIVQGDYARARALLGEGLRLYRTLGDEERIGWVLFLQAQTLFLSGANPAEAQVLAEQSLALMRKISHNMGIFYVLRLLGQLRLHQRELAPARELFEAVLMTAQEDDNQHEIAATQSDLARVLALQGEVARARTLYQESLAFLRKINTKEFLLPGLEGLASLEAGQGDPAWAAQLWGAAEAMREAIGAPLPPVYRPDYERAVAAARAQLGEHAFATAWVQGRMMTPGQAVASRGPATVSSASSAAPPTTRPSHTYPDDLTAREVEALRLLAQGLTDVQIADHLIISPRTVNNHLTSIYSKIQVSSRAAATRYAFEHQLV